MSPELELAKALVEIIPGDRGTKISVADALAPRLGAAVRAVALEQHAQTSAFRSSGRMAWIDESKLYDAACAAIRGLA